MSNVSLVDGHIDEPKMTDEEIKMALEYCARSMGAEACKGCPFSEKDICDNEDNAPQKYALDLIKRKDAESDILKAEIERLKDELAQTEDAFNKIYEMNGSYQRKIDTIKSEAIKEFAGRLKEKSFKPLGTWFNEKVVTEQRVDNILKEMVGD